MKKNQNPSQKLIKASKNIFGFNLHILNSSGEGGNKVSKDPVIPVRRNKQKCLFPQTRRLFILKAKRCF